MTGTSLVTASLRLIGALASGEPPGANESTDGLAALNRMIASWSNESLMIFREAPETFALIASQRSYTMGTGGNFNTTRPQRIERALLQVAGTSPTVELPIKILNLDEYADITIKDLTSTLPAYLYNDDSYPLASLSFWPVPSGIQNVVLYSWKPLTTWTDVTTDVTFPPGYEEALVYNLAIRLAPEYGKSVTPDVASIAAASKASIKRMNHNSSYLQVDRAIQSQSGGFNYYTGEST